MQKIAELMRAKAVELLQSGKAERVLAWRAGEFFYDNAPAAFNDVDACQEIVYNEFCPANLAKYLMSWPMEPDKPGFQAQLHYLQMEIPQSSVVWQENSKDHIVISLNDGATPGTWQLTAAMENVNSYLAFSMIINLPEGITVSHAENSERMPSHFLRYSGVKESGSEGKSQSTSNSSTLIAYSPQNSYIDGNSGTLFTLTLTAHNMGEGSYSIKLTDIRMVTGNGKEQSLASAETVLNISDTSISNINTEPVETTYFTLDGKQLHQPLPGITICRKVYPDGRVVVELKK